MELVPLSLPAPQTLTFFITFLISYPNQLQATVIQIPIVIYVSINVHTQPSEQRCLHWMAVIPPLSHSRVFSRSLAPWSRYYALLNRRVVTVLLLASRAGTFGLHAGRLCNDE